MIKKAFTWIAVMATIAALAASNVFAIDKEAGTTAGVPPRVVADYLRAVIMAHRHFYTLNIINRLVSAGVVDVSENWRGTHALPLPVQLLKETSEIAELTGPHVRYQLISQWPINKANAPSTEFERRGLEEVKAHPNRPYYGIIESNGAKLFGALYADLAVTSVCISCHNSHPSTPKSDFQPGDVMGGLLITFPVANR